MKLEIGMYVRTKFGISKIIEDGIVKIIKSDNEETYDVDKNGRHYPTQFRDYIWTSDVIKASHNIIDLIEVGDYVNGFRVDEVEHSKSTIFIGNTEKVIEQALWSNDIKSIVTKEQFESMSYKI